MISKVDFKKALGRKAQDLSEEQIEKLRVNMDSLAEILFDIWNTDVELTATEYENQPTGDL